MQGILIYLSSKLFRKWREFNCK